MTPTIIFRAKHRWVSYTVTVTSIFDIVGSGLGNIRPVKPFTEDRADLAKQKKYWTSATFPGKIHGRQHFLHFLISKDVLHWSKDSTDLMFPLSSARSSAWTCMPGSVSRGLISRQAGRLSSVEGLLCFRFLL